MLSKQCFHRGIHWPVPKIDWPLDVESCTPIFKCTVVTGEPMRRMHRELRLPPLELPPEVNSEVPVPCKSCNFVCMCKRGRDRLDAEAIS